MEIHKLIYGDETTEGQDTPSFGYTYGDAGSFAEEITELFSYAENPDLDAARAAFETDFPLGEWRKADAAARSKYVYRCLDGLEARAAKDRLQSLHKLLYLALGVYAECESNEEHEGQIVAHLVLLQVSCSSLGVILEAFLRAHGELEPALPEGASYHNVTTNTALRHLCSLVYLHLEVVRRLDAKRREATTAEDGLSPDEESFCRRVRADLGDVQKGKSLICVLLELIVAFKEGVCPHYPIKKLLLLLWKCCLVLLGDSATYRERKRAAFAADGLEVQESTVPKPAAPRTLVLQERGSARPHPNIERQAELSLLPPTRPEPKASQEDVERFIAASKAKFYGYYKDGAYPFPPSVCEALDVMKSRLYVSRAEQQAKGEAERFAEHRRHPYLGEELPLPHERSGLAEDLYAFAVGNLAGYTIALLRILLATARPVQVRAQKPGHIAVELVSELAAPSENRSLVEMTRCEVDEKRHKEIIVNAVTSSLLLLMRHFKLGHVYQFEALSEIVVESRGLPLLLKILNQNLEAYVMAQNCDPTCDMLFYASQSRVAPPTLEEAFTAPTCCGRNFHAIINIAKLLQKLTKNKQARILMLALEKAHIILSRCLKVRNKTLRLYALKGLKSLARYLGKNWRKSNMYILSAIDLNVTHHIHDSWFYDNQTEVEIKDFRDEEEHLRSNVGSFNHLYYLQPSEYHDHDDMLALKTISDVRWSEVDQEFDEESVERLVADVMRRGAQDGKEEEGLWTWNSTWHEPV